MASIGLMIANHVNIKHHNTNTGLEYSPDDPLTLMRKWNIVSEGNFLYKSLAIHPNS